MSDFTTVTILIPCYNQPQLLHRCLDSIRNQTTKDFNIILMDDCSSISYQEIIKINNDLPILYVRNEQNLGAVPNMIHCVQYPVNTKYKMVFHEDDIMYPSLLEDEIAVLDENEIGWAGSNMSFFSDVPVLQNGDEKQIFIYKKAVKDLVILLLQGSALSLGSIMYRTKITSDVIIDLEKYSMMGDRYMLLELTKQYGGGYLNYNLVAANDHGINDSRWETLRKEHIQNYYSYLSDYFETKEIKNKRVAAGFTHGFINAFKLLPSSFQNGEISFYWNAYKKGLFSFKFYLLSFNRLRHAVETIKGIKQK